MGETNGIRFCDRCRGTIPPDESYLLRRGSFLCKQCADENSGRSRFKRQLRALVRWPRCLLLLLAALPIIIAPTWWYIANRGCFGDLQTVLQDLKKNYKMYPPINFEPSEAHTAIIRGRQLYAVPIFRDASRPEVGTVYFDSDQVVRAMMFGVTPATGETGIRWSLWQVLENMDAPDYRDMEAVSDYLYARTGLGLGGLLDPYDPELPQFPVSERWKLIKKEKREIRSGENRHYAAWQGGFTAEVIVDTHMSDAGGARRVDFVMVILRDGSDIW